MASLDSMDYQPENRPLPPIPGSYPASLTESSGPQQALGNFEKSLVSLIRREVLAFLQRGDAHREFTEESAGELSNHSYLNLCRDAGAAGSRADLIEKLEFVKNALMQEQKSLDEKRPEPQHEAPHCKSNEQELSDARTQINLLKEQNTKLRRIVTSMGRDNTEMPDDAVVNRFAELRNTIQSIVVKFYEAWRFSRLEKAGNANFETQKGLRDRLGDMKSESMKTHLLRHTMFRIVLERLLREYTFGVSSKFEEHLQEFEDEITATAKASRLSQIEWRSRTIECAESLKTRSSLPKEAARAIIDFLQPWQKGTAASKGLEQSVKELCDNAYDLSVLMRKSRRANFSVTCPLEGAAFSARGHQQMLVQDFFGPPPEEFEGTAVVFTIFGGLTKWPEDAPERVTLEQAHVVCRP